MLWLSPLLFTLLSCSLCCVCSAWSRFHRRCVRCLGWRCDGCKSSLGWYLFGCRPVRTRCICTLRLSCLMSFAPRAGAVSAFPHAGAVSALPLAGAACAFPPAGAFRLGLLRNFLEDVSHEPIRTIWCLRAEHAGGSQLVRGCCKKLMVPGESFRLSLLASPLLLLTIDCVFNQPSKRRHFSPFAHPRQAAVGR